MAPAWRRITGLAALGLSVTVACGPNALPPASGARSDGVAAAPLLAPAAALAQGAVPSGRILFIKDGNLWAWQDGSAGEVAVGSTWRQPRWATDGSRFAYVYQGANFSDIFVGDRDGTDQTRLTQAQHPIIEDNDWNYRPTWSPDGRRIAFVSDAASFNPTLWVMAADGTGRRAIPTPGFAQEAVDQLSWSPDGATLAVSLFFGPEPSQVALVPVEATSREQARILTNHPAGALDPAWSPDGAWIAYAAREAQGTDVFAMRADGSASQQLTSLGTARFPAWSPDGRSLAYLSAQTNAFEVWVVDVVATSAGGIEARNPRQLTRDLGVDAPSGITWGP